MNLKKELFEDFNCRKEEIRCGNHIPKFNDYKNYPKYNSLTKKNFKEIRNLWIKEVLKKKNYLKFRDEIRTKEFFEENNEIYNLIQNKEYPEAVLLYRLTNLLKISLQELEIKVYGNNENRFFNILKKRGNFIWEGKIEKIKDYILSLRESTIKKKAIKEFQTYLKLKVYYGFKPKNKNSNFSKFRIDDYPEGWLILNLCEINLISVKKLGKLIEYDDLPYHLTSLRSFHGNRLKKIKEFIKDIDSDIKRNKSIETLSKYIKFIVFCQIREENYPKLEHYLNYNIKKWLAVNLCGIYLITLSDLGKLIKYKDLSTIINRKYELSDVSIEKIRKYIDKTCDINKKERATRVFKIYLKRAIYYRYKMTDLPKFKDFKSKMHPALWLVIQICSIYLFHPFELEKSIGYSELAKRLKNITYFTNITLGKFKKFIRNNGTSFQKESARKAITRFLEVRNKEFERYFGPKIQNLEKLSDYPELVEHLEYVYKLGNFPEEILEGYHEFPRISKFNNQFRFIKNREKRAFIKKMISKGFIKVIDPSDCYADKSVRYLIEFSKNKYYTPSEIYPSHGSPRHESVLNMILEKDPYSIGMEIPIWIWHEDHFLTGHIDLILYIDGIIYICDYKPEETPNTDTTRLSYSFMRSVPQVASYALVLKYLFGIEGIKCVTFNKKGAWIFEPKLTLNKLNEFIKKYKQYKVEDRPWEKYFFNK